MGSFPALNAVQKNWGVNRTNTRGSVGGTAGDMAGKEGS